MLPIAETILSKNYHLDFDGRELRKRLRRISRASRVISNVIGKQLAKFKYPLVRTKSD